MVRTFTYRDPNFMLTWLLKNPRKVIGLVLVILLTRFVMISVFKTDIGCSIGVVDTTLSGDYMPSTLEQAWLSDPRTGQICALNNAQIEGSNLWLNYSTDVFHPKGKAARNPSTEEQAVLSTIWTQGRMQPIEPLTGIARHPFSKVGCKLPSSEPTTSIFNITYLLLTNDCDAEGKPHNPEQKKFLFDLGCTTFGNGDQQVASAAAPSMPLFMNLYKERCIDFDEMHGWEGVPYDHDDWWSQVPKDVAPKLHFNNEYVVEDDLGQLRKNHYKETSEESFLRKLPRMVKKEDFVVLKIDIDGGPELQIVEAIANRPELAAVVDELLFEYHFWFDGLHFGWKPNHSETVDDALDLMHKLRRAGVRSHFWI